MKTVIEMAREAGWDDHHAEFDTRLKRFAELVRADERRAMMQLFTDPENQPTQHGTVTVKYMNRELSLMEEHCAELILAEREACAQLCAEDASGRDSGGYYAEIIRDRGNT